MSTISENLLAAYRWNRAADPVKLYPRPKGPCATATEALERARFDIAANRTRYPWTGKPIPAVCWQAPERNGRGERLGFVQSLDGAGLRYVGRASIEMRRGAFDDRESEGYYTDPYAYGEVSKDGTGLCWGVVYQLPARAGRARFVAGYIMGGCSDDLPTVDFGTIYETEFPASDMGSDARDYDAARDAARAADSMAQHAAEQEREYQSAWAAGSEWAQLGDEIASERKAALELLQERRRARAAGLDGYKAICATMRAAIESHLTSIREAREKRESLERGDGGGSEYMLFWPGDATLKAAFNDGAGETVIT